jgi:ribonuclease-3
MTEKWIQLEKRIGYSFKNKDLIKQALTHSSFAYESQEGGISDNEVLEFLGDSVLGLIVADFLVSAFPSLPEGELSKLRSVAASTTSLFHFAKKIKLDRYVLLGKGEEKSGGRVKKTILAGTFEAIIAAIYLDGGLARARDFLSDHLNSFYKKVNVEKFLINN